MRAYSCLLYSLLTISLAAYAEVAPLRFAVIGDYGSRDQRESEVANLVKGWKPDFIITVGDNAYSAGKDPFKGDVLDYFGEYIQSPAQDPTATRTRFFPTLGNHDLTAAKVFDQARLDSYRATFALPAGGEGRFYEFVRGPVHFFALDSNPTPQNWGGTKLGSTQERWFRAALQKALGEKKEPWLIAYFHHSPYHSSTHHVNDLWMRAWKLEEAGLTAVITGHEHHYERVMKNGVAFIVDGTGGAGLYPIDEQHLVDGSVVHYPASPGATAARGALLVEATAASIRMRFMDTKGQVIDSWLRTTARESREAKLELVR